MIVAAAAVARDVGDDPRLVEELAGRAEIDLRGAEVLNRVAAVLVVVVDEARDEDLAELALAAIEGDAAVVEEAARAGAHGRVGGGGEALDRRGGTCRET